MRRARKAIELSRGAFTVNGGVFSPDGRLVTYSSNETESFKLSGFHPFDVSTGGARATPSRECRRRAPEA